MEAPVAAALGKLDAFNLFDPYWMDPEWDVWYGLLSCGLRLPASTGSDWFVCSSNRVYVQTGAGSDVPDGDHEHGAAPGTLPAADHRSVGADQSTEVASPARHYRQWLDGLAAGRSFITNGPALWLTVEGRAPGQSLDGGAQGAQLNVELRWQAAAPVHRVELIRNGRVVERAAWEDGRREGTCHWRTPAGGAGEWLAARCFGRDRNSYGHFLWAHTSPVYLGTPADTARPSTPEALRAARHFVAEIGRSLEWIGGQATFREPGHRQRMIDLFRQAEEVYRQIAG
jgi:hypothetical protein